MYRKNVSTYLPTPRHYWRYRMHLTLEQLMKAESLNEKIKELVKQTGRKPEK